jgi:hypothetical protein
MAFSISVLILRSAAGASRRMLQFAPDTAGRSFETPLSRLLRMRVGIKCPGRVW